MRLGIDFGTTRTVVAAAHEGRYPIASFSTDDGFVDYLPGIACLDPDGLRFGTEIMGAPSLEGNFRGLVRSVKDTVSGAAPDETVWRLRDSGISALDLTTKYLRYIKRMLEVRSNLDLHPDEPLEAMVAVPAHASTRQRYLTLEAFSRAGFHVLGLLNEPTAAAVEFARHTLSALSARSPKRYVVVYDLGGGTFDAAGVSLVDRRFDLIGAEGISYIGGGDFDEIIACEVLKKCQIRREQLSGPAYAHLLERCRVGKESLSSNSKKILVDVSDVFEKGPELLLVDTAPVYEAAAPLVEKTLQSCDTLFSELADHGIDPENPRELGAVYLVGGSVQFPAVRRSLRKKYGRKVQLAPQPHAATAVGLAIAADREAGIFVREAPTRHFGVWREQDGGREKVFDPLIERRKQVTEEGLLRVERTYYPAHPVGLLRFVECTDLDSSHQPTGEVTPWENVLFPYDPSLVNCSDLSFYMSHKADSVFSQQIVETYEYAPSGMITVNIENRTSGYKREYVLGRAS